MYDLYIFTDVHKLEFITIYVIVEWVWAKNWDNKHNDETSWVFSKNTPEFYQEGGSQLPEIKSHKNFLVLICLSFPETFTPVFTEEQVFQQTFELLSLNRCFPLFQCFNKWRKLLGLIILLEFNSERFVFKFSLKFSKLNVYGSFDETSGFLHVVLVVLKTCSSQWLQQ